MHVVARSNIIATNKLLFALVGFILIIKGGAGRILEGNFF